MRMIGFFYDFKDYVFKMVENMVRFVVLFYYFSGDGGDIFVIVVKVVVEIVVWYIEEYICLFFKKEEFFLDVLEVDEFYCWIKDYCM